MKTLKSIAAVSLLAAGATGLASANTTAHIYIVGAPAYRAESIATIDAVVHTFSGAGETASSSSNSNFSNTNQVQWLIPNYQSGIDLEVNASFTGSTAGVEAVASGLFPQKFIPDGTGTVASPVTGGSASESHQPDITLSDTFQGTTPFNTGTVKLEIGATAGTFQNVTFSTITGAKLGVEQYRWVGTHGLAARGVTNITTAQAQLLYKNGQLPLSFFTGKNSDETSYVYPLSRDPGSGSRLIALAETGVGVKTSIQTYKPTVTGATADSSGNFVHGSITDSAFDPNSFSGGPNLYPAGQISSTTIFDPNAGDTGYPSFGTKDQTGLLAAITSIPTDTNAFYVTYLDTTDAQEAEAAGAEELTWNGVSAGVVGGVTEGFYTFWSYEQLYKSPTIGSTQSSFANAVAAAFPAHADIPLSTLNVQRGADGGPITSL
ncbi:MAG: hypothetical protein WDO13_21045 [Verrucomicrobiota bacterium]